MNLSKLEYAIVSTLVYYKALGAYPLTSFEIYSRLNAHVPSPTYAKILNILCLLVKHRIVAVKNGLFYVKNPKSRKKEAVENRIERYKISIRKWRILERALKYLNFLPYIQMIGVTGSLSINNASKESDLDLLVITSPGRIWISRILCSLITHLLGIRRYKNKIKDRICLNHYITTDALTLKIRNLSNAHTYAGIIPVLNEDAWHKKFQEQNRWMKRFLSLYPWGLEESKRCRKKSFLSSIISSLFEFILQNKLGNVLEKIFHHVQKRKILANISPMRPPTENHLIISDNILMFHYPISRNEEVEKKYKEIMQQLDLR